MTYEEKRKEIHRLAGNVDLMTDNIAARDDICWLITELEKAWGALEFYAEDAWKVHGDTSCGRGAGGQQMTCRIDYDQGKRAREALNS